MKRFKMQTPQSIWVSVTLVALAVFMTLSTDSFGTGQNIFNITRNAAFVGIMVLGQTLVIITGGIDLSVGSVMGLSGIACALALESGATLSEGIVAGLLVAILCGLINGALISYLRLSAFVVTLGMISIARSLSLVISSNRMVYEFGPHEEKFLNLGSSELLGVAYPVIVVLAGALIFGVLLRQSVWGKHLYALGGNEEASRLNGLRIERLKVSVYILSALTAGVSGVLSVAWLGSASTSLGTGYELTVIAAAVIGGANLFGGAGGVFGALVGALFIETIRNSLLLFGVDSYWQGTFVGLFIILAVVIEALKSKRGST